MQHRDWKTVREYEEIRFDLFESIAKITISRPRYYNAFTPDTTREMSEALVLCREMTDVRVVILTGAGDKAFCGGGEVKVNVAAAVAGIDRPVIAAINGDALGEGLELALSCDIRLASNKARFGLPQVASGIIPMDGGTQRLPRLVGKGKALELILTAETISAEEALEIGLVNKVIAGENLASEVEAMAKTIVGKGPIALRYAKEAINKGLDLTLEQGLHLEADLYFLLHTTADRTEGITAFLQKRPAQFKSR